MKYEPSACNVSWASWRFTPTNAGISKVASSSTAAGSGCAAVVSSAGACAFVDVSGAGASTVTVTGGGVGVLAAQPAVPRAARSAMGTAHRWRRIRVFAVYAMKCPSDRGSSAPIDAAGGSLNGEGQAGTDWMRPGGE